MVGSRAIYFVYRREAQSPIQRQLLVQPAADVDGLGVETVQRFGVVQISIAVIREHAVRITIPTAGQS